MSDLLIVVPARGGSKGIPNKNLKKVCGESLTARAIRFGLSLNISATVMVTSDSEKILNEANRAGAHILRKRPSELAGDLVSDVPVLRDALFYAEEKKAKKFEILAMLQPTSPIRCVNYFLENYHLIHQKDYSAIWSVDEVSKTFHPFKVLLSDANGVGRYAHPEGHKIVARQQLGAAYARNGVLYLVKRDTLIESGLMGEELFCSVTPFNTVNIDTIKDLNKARRMLSREKS